MLRPDEISSAVGGISQARVFTGHWMLSENGGPIIATSVHFEISPTVALIQYADGVPHVTRSPEAIAYLNDLIPSLERISS